MNEQVKPSTGALRAAREIWQRGEHDNLFTIYKAALLIDRETGVGELLEAAKDAHALLEMFAHGRGLDPREASTKKRLEQAIAKCEGKQ
jgi:hypothetical protein